MELKKAIEQFIDYTSNYLEYGDYCTLKIEHTKRVMELCKDISSSLNLTKEDQDLAILCGMLHDIGRFEQWKRYQTDCDSKSKDHGLLGVEILKENDFIKNFTQDKEEESIIMVSTYFHNKYEISEGLSEREKLFCNIVRDADKIDILYLYWSEQLQSKIGNKKFSEKIYNDLRNQKLIKITDKRTKEDTLSIPLSFIYDMKFPRSIEILKEKDYLNDEINKYQSKTKNKVFQEQLETVKEDIKRYIKERS